MRLLGISGTITGSKTLAVVGRVLEEVNKLSPGTKTELLDLRRFEMQFCDGRDITDYNKDTRYVLEAISAADFYVIGTPVFQASLTGALKNVFDLVPPSVFRHKVMGFVATGGTYQHYLVIENQLKPIAGYFRAYVAPGSVYVHNDHFRNGNELANDDVLERIAQLAEQLVHMQMGLMRS